jgi:amino acid adenylation domain-containing protein
MAGHFQVLLEGIATHPAENIAGLPLLTTAEQEHLLKDFRNIKVEIPDSANIVHLFEAQVAKTPGNVAAVFKSEQLTYEELNRRSNQLAHYLRRKGVNKETLVPVFTDRSVEMIVGILGILKAGGAYVPIDPEYPSERISYMLEDTGAALLITNLESHSKLPQSGTLEWIVLDRDRALIEEQSAQNPGTDLRAHHLAYVIYTSGTTGKPKGVMIEHGSLVHYLLNSKTKYISDSQGGSGSFVHMSYTFDASLTAMFMPLLSGKAIVIGSKQSISVFEDENLWKYAPYDFLKVTPSHLQMLQHLMEDDQGRLLTGKLVVGGEALVPAHFDYLVQKGMDVEIINEYGPTEATVGCSTYSLKTLGYNEKVRSGISIGKPIDNIQMYILDAGNGLVPVGVVGEICIGGTGLARGYKNRPELTAEKFIAHPFAKENHHRLYKTGDLARWLPDGNIQYLGRRDEQVKIRGYRIELGEIENVLLQSNLISKAVVLVTESGSDNKQLTGYVVPHGSFDKQVLMAYLNTKLPQYMVPALWIEMMDLPLTVNGKIDKKALQRIERPELLGSEYVAPATDIEQKLADIWKELLQLKTVSIHDNFFQLGGHSLIIMRLISLIRKELQLELTIKDFFQFNTIHSLSKYIELMTVADSNGTDITEFELINI